MKHQDTERLPRFSSSSGYCWPPNEHRVNMKSTLPSTVWIRMTVLDLCLLNQGQELPNLLYNTIQEPYTGLKRCSTESPSALHQPGQTLARLLGNGIPKVMQVLCYQAVVNPLWSLFHCWKDILFSQGIGAARSTLLRAMKLKIQNSNITMNRSNFSLGHASHHSLSSPSQSTVINWLPR